MTNEICIDVGGTLAEQRLLGEPWPDSFDDAEDLTEDYSPIDWQSARRLKDLLYPEPGELLDQDEMEEPLRLAKKIVNQNWDKIEAVATELLGRRVLTYEEVLRVGQSRAQALGSVPAFA